MEKKNKNDLVRREVVVTELHVREAGEGEAASRTIVGRAILFNTPSAPLWSDDEEEAREIIAPEAITKELLDGCDIKFTMFHDRQLILARSNKGTGTLSYTVDDKGVAFEFEAPNTVDGDKALELVKRGGIAIPLVKVVCLAVSVGEIGVGGLVIEFKVCVCQINGVRLFDRVIDGVDSQCEALTGLNRDTLAITWNHVACLHREVC